jgi:hypothetical protein
MTKSKAKRASGTKNWARRRIKRTEKHQPPAQPMSGPPDFGIFEGPRRADADKIVGTHSAKVISDDDEKDEHTSYHDPATGEVAA